MPPRILNLSLDIALSYSECICNFYWSRLSLRWCWLAKNREALPTSCRDYRYDPLNGTSFIWTIWRVQRGSVGSALACCKAGPSSNLGSAPHGVFTNWDDSCEYLEIGLSECLSMNEWMNEWFMHVSIANKKNKCKKSGLRPPNLYFDYKMTYNQRIPIHNMAHRCATTA